MSRQIVNTRGQGLASSDGSKFAILALIAAIVVLLIFFGLDKSGMGDHNPGTTATMGAPAPAAT